MSKRLDVLEAVKAMVKTALPGTEVLGLDGDDAPPARVGALGRVIVRSGDLGDPEVDLSPLSYNWQHRVPIEIVAYQSAGRTSEEAVDDMAQAIGAAVEADRSLGGLCDWLEPTPPLTDDVFVEGARPPKGADFDLVAFYATANPLT